MVIDVRPKTEFGICSLPNSTSECTDAEVDNTEKIRDIALNVITANPREFLPTDSNSEVYVVCRLGNDSQIAVDALRGVAGKATVVKDVIGGLRAWSKHVDPNFPVY